MDCIDRMIRVAVLALSLCVACEADGSGPRRDSGPGADTGGGADDAGNVDTGPAVDTGPRPDAPMGFDSGTCADVTLETRIVEPTVTLIIDQSLSMERDLEAGVTRWDAVHRALTAGDGLVTSLESRVRFGLALYSDEQGGSAACPMITDVPATLFNRGPIDAAYRAANPLGETPTGDALSQILASITPPGPDDDPHIFVLATDGGPDRCGMPDAHDDESRRLSRVGVESAHSVGIRTFVIAVGEGTVARAHLQELADAGVGAAGAPFYEATDTAGLRDTLRMIVASELSCTVELDGRINPDVACMGEVELDGTPLECDGADGWRAVDETHIELVGDACERLQTEEVTLSARFPCEVIII